MMVVLDHYSKFVCVKAMPSATSARVIAYLRDAVFGTFNVPEYLVSDNGSQFTSGAFKDFLRYYGVTHVRTPLYSPQSNAVERVNRTLLAAIRSYITVDHRRWNENLDAITSALRDLRHESIRCSPHFALFGSHKVHHGTTYQLLRDVDQLTFGDVTTAHPLTYLRKVQSAIREHLQSAYVRTEQRYNLRSRPRAVAPGQMVYVRSHVQSNALNKFASKLAPKFIRAWVVRLLGTTTCELRDHAGTSLGVYHLRDIKTT